MAWSLTTALTPYLGLYGDYYFSSNNGGTVLLPSQFIHGGAGRVIGGVGSRFDNGVKLSVGAEYGGIGNNFQNWTVMGRISIPLATLFGEPTPMAARAISASSLAVATPADAPRTRQVASLDPAAAAPPTTSTEQVERIRRGL
jgi:hypothetical protein